MITLDESIGRVLDEAGDGMAIDRKMIVEKEYGWVLFPNSREYIETGDMKEMLVGSGGVLVLKETGRMIQFGSAFNLETNLKIFELGYLDHDNWDIVITRIRNEREAVDLICCLGATYVIPECEFGVEWRVPKAYTVRQIQKMIRDVPLRMNLGGIYFNHEFIESLKKQNFFEYRLEPNDGYENRI